MRQDYYSFVEEQIGNSTSPESATWWDRVEHSENWQKYSSYGLAFAYGVLFLFATVQLFRLSRHDAGGQQPRWTIQKTFHLVNSIVTGLRCLEFAFRAQIHDLQKHVGLEKPFVRGLMFDIPGLLFFNAYSIVVLFWAQIYHQSQGVYLQVKMKPIYFGVNAAIYTLVIGLLVLMGRTNDPWPYRLGVTVSAIMAALSLLLAGVYLLYGLRLFLLLKRFPIESRGRKRKLREVGQLTAVCSLCFVIRCTLILAGTIDKDLALDMYDHPLLNVLFYLVCEIIPTAWVFYSLRKPPPRNPPQTTTYQPLQSDQSSSAA